MTALSSLVRPSCCVFAVTSADESPNITITSKLGTGPQQTSHLPFQQSLDGANNLIEWLFRHQCSVRAYYARGNLPQQHPVSRVRTSKGKNRKAIPETGREGPKGSHVV
jgi:hypothetical protein